MFDYRSDTTNNRRTVSETQSPEGNGRSDRRILQENTVFVDNPTSSTITIVINDCCSLAFSQDAEDGLDGNGDSDSSQDCSQYTELVQDKDADDAPLSPLKTIAHTSATDNVPTDIAAGPDQAPVQPKMKFPATLKGNKHRSFRADRYKRYRLLEYSRERNAAYCYPCRLFTTEPGKYWETFTFSDWKHAMGKDGIIPCHDHCKTHMQAWQEYMKNKESGTSVANKLDAARSKLITKNRHYLKTILEVLLACSQQEIALRGHDESMKSLNRGDFLEILKLIASHDEVVNERLMWTQECTLPIIQNELLHIMGEMIQSIICCKIREAGLFSILVDETKDISCSEMY